MKLLPYLLTFVAGFLACFYLTKKGCFTPTTNIEYVNTVEYRFRDTIIYEKVLVPVPVVTEKIKIDSIIREKFTDIYHVDKFYVDTSLNMVINKYSDTVETLDYKMKYNIETLGYLTNFENEVIVTKDSTVNTITKMIKPKFCVQAGMSNLFHPKFGVGYKGWMLELEFNPINQKPKFQQFFITKQFTF